MRIPDGYRPQGDPGATVFEVMPFGWHATSRQNGFGRREAGRYESQSEGESQYQGPYQGEEPFGDEYEGQGDWAGQGAGPFSEADEIALAAELLSVSNEAELAQFLGKLWSGIRKSAQSSAKSRSPLPGC